MTNNHTTPVPTPTPVRTRTLPRVPHGLTPGDAVRIAAFFGTLDGACSAIAHRHHEEGLADPTADVTVRRVRRGLRRIMGTAPHRQAHPLTVDELDRIVSTIDPATAIGARDRAVILLGYASALRPSELSALDLADISAKPTGILVAVRRSKTDQDGHGQLVGVARGQHRQTDPLRALDAWLKIRPAGQAHSSPATTRPAPPPPNASAPEPSADSCRHAPSRPASTASLSPATLRAGHATTAAVNGAPIDRIAAQTRHRDLGTLLNHYIRPAEALTNSTSRDVGL